MGFDPFTYWNDFFSNAIRDQRRMADAWGVAFRGLAAFRDMTLFWQKMWGTEKGHWGVDPSKMSPGFFPFPTQGLSYALGMVPMHEYLSLVRRYEEMKERVAEKEETIRNLKLLLKSDGGERKGRPTGIEELMKKQVDAFFSLMRGMPLPPYK